MKISVDPNDSSGQLSVMSTLHSGLFCSYCTSRATHASPDVAVGKEKAWQFIPWLLGASIPEVTHIPSSPLLLDYASHMALPYSKAMGRDSPTKCLEGKETWKYWGEALMLTTQTSSLFSLCCKLSLQTQPQPQPPFQPGGCPEAIAVWRFWTATAAGDL